MKKRGTVVNENEGFEEEEEIESSHEDDDDPSKDAMIKVIFFYNIFLYQLHFKCLIG